MERERIEEQINIRSMSWDGMENGIEAFKDGAEWAIQELQPKWIDVRTKKPQYGKHVIVWCKIYGRYVTTYNDLESGGQWKGCDGAFGNLPPLYWAEINLPNPPQEIQL